jgi:membrane protein YdbS with pleckstrin-like domain
MWSRLLLLTGWLWYIWRIYTLTVNWATFPNPESARAIWQRRSNFSLWLGAAVLNDTLYSVGLIQRWWVIALSLLACFLVVSVVQPFLIPSALALIMSYRGWKLARGEDPANTFLAQLAISLYLNRDEKNALKRQGK